MTFQEKLNSYIEPLGLTGKELAEKAGISPSLLSLWRSGRRLPKPGSESLKRLADCIAPLLPGEQAGGGELLAELQGALIAAPALKEENLNLLMDALDITPAQLSRQLKYDTSYVSRIRQGKRRPANPLEFANGAAVCALRALPVSTDRSALAKLLETPVEALADDDVCIEKIVDWLFHGESKKVDYIGRFLNVLERFDLNQYTRALDFTGISFPDTLSEGLPQRRLTGLDEMKMGELAFLAHTVASPSAEPLFLYSNLPFADIGKDIEFGKQWIFGLASAMRKGLRFHVIHDVDRPLEEMLLGLESWVPLYMTGQVTPYYFSGGESRVLQNMVYVSGGASLLGVCPAGSRESGWYEFSTDPRDIRLTRILADKLLEKASPLMNIYREDSKSALELFLQTDAGKPGKRRSILSAPPIYTMSPQLLEQILRRNQIQSDLSEKIKAFAETQRESVTAILSSNSLSDEFRRLSPEEFAESPAVLSLSLGFFGVDIRYAYEEYLEHIRQTEAFAGSYANYSFDSSSRRAFRNIQITFHEGQWVMLSKSQSPTIHFVIRHPKLRAALENMIVPVVE